MRARMWWGNPVVVAAVIALEGIGCTLVTPAARRSADYDAGGAAEAGDASRDASLDAARDAQADLDAGAAWDGAAIDAEGLDGGSADAGSADAGSADAASADAGSLDGGSADAGSADAGSADASTATDAFVSPDACTPVSGYVDGDMDGVGAGALVASCAERGIVLVAAAGDCDDTRSDVHPGATDAMCDGIDADCDGVADPAEVDANAACPWRRCVASGSGAACDRPVALAGGGFHTCTRLASSGDVWCWGANDVGQLGAAASGDEPRPIRSRYSGARGLCAGLAYTCVALADRVECFGASALSSAASTWFRSVDAVEVACGLNHVCVRTSTGNVRCAGTNGNGGIPTGQIGVDPAMGVGPFTDLVSVPLSSDAVQLAVGTNFTCARLDDGSIHCWGADGGGILGRGPATLSGVTHLAAPVYAPGATFVDVVAATYGACARTSSSVQCWGYAGLQHLLDLGTSPAFRTEPTAAPGRTFAALAGSPGHLCGVDASGTPSCWGLDNTGAMARASRVVTNTSVAAPALPLAGPTALAVDALGLGFADDPAGRGHGGHSCAIERGTGAVWCWGANGHGQCGAAPVAMLPDAARVEAP